jgi:hypothetical protein
MPDSFQTPGLGWVRVNSKHQSHSVAVSISGRNCQLLPIYMFGKMPIPQVNCRHCPWLHWCPREPHKIGRAAGILRATCNAWL